MSAYYFPISLTVIATLLYHVSQKSIHAGANPVLALIVTYVVALFFSLLALPFYPLKAGIVEEFKLLNWAIYLLGFSIFGIELGFLLAYRAGWNISLAGIYSNICVALLLLPVGFLLFKEHLNGYNLAGIGLAIFAIVLMSKQ